MAGKSIVFTNAMVHISSSTAHPNFDEDDQNVSSHVTSVTLTQNLDELEDTVMGEKDKSRKAGLTDSMMDVELIQSFSEGSGLIDLDALLQERITLSKAGKSFTVAVRPTTATQSASNPTYAMQGAIFSHTPVGGAVGEILKTTASFKSAGGSLERLTSATA